MSRKVTVTTYLGDEPTEAEIERDVQRMKDIGSLAASLFPGDVDLEQWGHQAEKEAGTGIFGELTITLEEDDDERL